MSVIALVATIPLRRRSCERLLAELAQQSRKPDGVVLVLDGYGTSEAPAGIDVPKCSLQVTGTRVTTAASGAGQRWLFIEEMLRDEKVDADDIVVCLDDDIMLGQAPELVEALVIAVETGGGAAAAMGRAADGKSAPPGTRSRGLLLHAAGCGLACRVRHLVGLGAFADTVKTAGGPDALGLRGDDDALVSAFFWKQGISIVHAATGNIHPAPNTQASSLTKTLQRSNTDLDAQKKAIRKATGWPWRVQ